MYQVFAVLALLCLSAVPAWAQEVPPGTTTVRVPVVLPAESAIAGGEIGFTQTGGLEYKKFIPAAGVQNPVKATVEGVTYVGFFSADNDYQPTDGGVVMGALEFSYAGDGAEQIVLQEMRLHTKAADNVDTQTLTPGTVYSVTRASLTGNPGDGGDSGAGPGGSGAGGGGSGENDSSGGEGGGDSGGGSGDSGAAAAGTGSGSSGGGAGPGSSSGSGRGGVSGSGSGGWGTIADGDGAVLLDENGNPVIELAPDSSTSSSGAGATSATPGGAGGGTTNANSSTNGTTLGNPSTPLTATSPAGEAAQSSFGWFLGGAILLVAIAVATILLLRRRNQNQGDQ
jgi:hypothetical protein